MATLPAAIPEFLQRHRSGLEAALRGEVGVEPGGITAAARYVLGWEDEKGRESEATGKRLRPLLCLFTAELLGGDAGPAMPGAVAIELIHNFSLVHDDLQDRDMVRHGRPAAWALHGEAQAINLGDFLYARAIRAITRAGGPADRRMAALSALLDATGRMIEGQWQDIGFESRAMVTADEYLAMVAAKTGALLGASLALGAIMAGAPPVYAPALARWGEHAGIAFQLRDDHLGAWGDPGETGKPAGGDIIRRKKSLPIVLGLQDPRAAATIREVYARHTIDGADVATVLSALEGAGCRHSCEEMAARHSAGADALLAGLPLAAESRARLTEVAAYLVGRQT